LSSLRAFAPYLWPAGRPELRRRVGAALLLLLAAKLVNVAVPYLLKWSVDSLSARPGVLVLPFGLILAYGAARIGALVFGELRDLVFAKVASQAVRRLALQTFDHLHQLSLRFHLERQTGGLSRVIERGTQGIQFMLRLVVFNILPTLFEIALVGAILYATFGFAYSGVILVTVFAYVLYTLLVTEWRTKYRREMNERDTQANTRAIDSLLNYETVKYFGNERFEARRYDEALARYERAALKSQTTLSVLNIGQGAVVALGLIGIMTMAAAEVHAGTLTLGDFVLVNAFLLQLYLPLNFLGTAYREIQQGLTDMEKMFELLGVGVEVPDRPGAKPLVIGGGEIRFERVSFRYDPNRPILEDIDFAVPPGRKVAIVGPSGAGKTTLARLLFRFYDVRGGRVLIDGQDIRDVSQASLRAAIGVVPQDTVLFNDTLGYNIRYGRTDATEAEIDEAAKLAHLETFVARLPDRYQTMVGERGLKLSGGEKQRVAIARAILKRPQILVFDEATSALDSRAEQEIQRNLAEVAADRTVLVIAHRLSTVVDADEILVLDQGRIVERGRHAELLRRKGAYAAMWQRQQEAAEYRARLAAIGAEPALPEASRTLNLGAASG
jgi:ATP-binding cassette subfamily B protein